MHDDPELQKKFASILPSLDERQRRLLAAAEARSLGYGGVRRVSRASGISHTAIQRALKQLDAPPPPPVMSADLAVAARRSVIRARLSLPPWRS